MLTRTKAQGKKGISKAQKTTVNILFNIGVFNIQTHVGILKLIPEAWLYKEVIQSLRTISTHIQKVGL